MAQRQEYAGTSCNTDRGIPAPGRNAGWVLRIFLLGLMIFNQMFGFIQVGRAESDPPITDAVSSPSLAKWELARWQDGGTVCTLYLRHETSPTLPEVSTDCGVKVSQDWSSTPVCVRTATTPCTGLFTRLVGRISYASQKPVSLPSIEVKIGVGNCIPGSTCGDPPVIKVAAAEPVQSHKITRIHVRFDNLEETFDGNNCQVKLPLTNDLGGTLSYWADSDMGDASRPIQIKYRSVSTGGDGSPAYRFDLLYYQWKDYLPPGSLLFGIFPPSNIPTAKPFEQPLTPAYLATTNRFVYLAEKLISSKQVDASSCDFGGLSSSGGANPCGEKLAAPRVLAIQNQYDAQIYQAALKYQVPARVLKGIIAQESQFWSLAGGPYEQGLGQVTENGVSMLLAWNTSYFSSLCAPIYGESLCRPGYSQMPVSRQTILRRMVWDKVGTPDEIDLVGAMLYASANQVAQMFHNELQKDPAGVTSYEDLWKISIANYHAGSGCVGDSLHTVASGTPPVTWDLMVKQLPPGCQVADTYVQKVLEYAQ